jgi:hypothetical protein
MRTDGRDNLRDGSGIAWQPARDTNGAKLPDDPLDLLLRAAAASASVGRRPRLHSHTCSECGATYCTCLQDPCPYRGTRLERDWVCVLCVDKQDRREDADAR